jgi:hypothetical protein
MRYVASYGVARQQVDDARAFGFLLPRIIESLLCNVVRAGAQDLTRSSWQPVPIWHDFAGNRHQPDAYQVRVVVDERERVQAAVFDEFSYTLLPHGDRQRAVSDIAQLLNRTDDPDDNAQLLSATFRDIPATGIRRPRMKVEMVVSL